MKRVILTVGPRGAGKTTFCRQIVAERPDIGLVVADEIMEKLTGWEDSYMHIFQIIQQLAAPTLERLMSQEVTTIFDVWNPSPYDREMIVRRIRSLGAEQVDAWYFVTDKDKVIQQFTQREGEVSVEGITRDFHIYHSYQVTTEQGFDSVTLINPHQLTFWPYANLLIP